VRGREHMSQASKYSIVQHNTEQYNTEHCTEQYRLHAPMMAAIPSTVVRTMLL
jgi:hypothetical protein